MLGRTPNPKEKCSVHRTKSEQESGHKAVEWGIFRLRECQATLIYWTFCGYLYMHMTSLAPIVSPGRHAFLLGLLLRCIHDLQRPDARTQYFQKMFRTTAAEAGAYLVVANLLHIPCSILSGVVESALISRFETLPIRIGMTAFASVMHGLSAMLFGLASSVRQAMMAYGLFVLGIHGNSGGIIPNL